MPLTSPRATAGAAGAGRNIPLHAFSGAPLRWENVVEYLRMISKVVNGILDGKINSTGTITLTENSATSTLSDRRIGADSIIHLMPTTANAAAEIGNGTIYVSSRGKQTATVTHANNAQTDRTFGYTVLG